MELEMEAKDELVMEQPKYSTIKNMLTLQFNEDKN